MTNWIADNSGAEQPAAHFLQRIYDFDSMLLILPSRATPGAYVLARRKQFGPGLTEAALGEGGSNPDTRMCLAHSAVPVCMMFQAGDRTWNADLIIQKLRARDLWAVGGGDAAADLLESRESAEVATTRAAIRDDLYNRSGAAWRSYQARTGQTSNLFHDRKDSPSTGLVAAPEEQPLALEAPQDGVPAGQ